MCTSALGGTGSLAVGGSAVSSGAWTRGAEVEVDGAAAEQEEEVDEEEEEEDEC
jgi:hypothetical protein